MTTLAAQIDSTGISSPTYQTILASLTTTFQGIYGNDIYIEPDSQDGQLLATIAMAIHDANQSLIATYNAQRPSGAIGEGLSSVVKINGIARQPYGYSTAEVTIIGQATTIITSGIVSDVNGYLWSLPASVVIPVGGEITVTATCQTAGAIAASPNTITQIYTPTRGWQSVTNAADAVVGAAVESDAALRRRQKQSTANPSVYTIDTLIGGIAAVSGVSEYVIIENDSAATDSNGIPGHSVAAVVYGGTDAAIADAIATRKAIGTGTYGTSYHVVYDEKGAPLTIRFSRPTLVEIQVQVTITPLVGYNATIGAALSQAIMDYINSLNIGDDVLYHRLFTPANLDGAANSATYDIQSLQVCRVGGSLAAANVTLSFTEWARCSNLSNITVIVS